MNLIEKLGLEKCKQIVDGAPEGSEMWRDMDSVCSPGEVLYYRWFGGALLVHDVEKGWVKSIYHDGNEYILDQLELLSDLKSEIDHHYYGRSEAEELAAYAELSQEKIEGGAMLVGRAAIREMDEVIKLQDADLRKYEKQIEGLKEQLNNMEACYIEKKKQVEELQGQIDASKSSQPKLHKTEIGDCLHFSTTMFHDGKATCFDCDAVVNHKREVIGVMQTKALRGAND